ncbi:hypothetical protein AUC43_07385 [Hymenobacter sedentarius]|uniref:Outer membrane protein beta-barrel domain-containing protein n=1 Tax=Hymenobacter sedentarius TaxID=1411621 RepID=A0A0U4AMX7_9BACT|nr:hypothetical protein [Hymenobacter sedentarius]ALW84928.1 hypothetical protein AUC43_07385 [Hymenobacter sedentarius]
MRIKALVLGVVTTAGIISSQTVQAQHYGQKRHYNSQGRPYYRGPAHITFGAGTGLYNGDLGNSPSDNFFGPAFSAGGLYRLTPHLKIGGEFSYVKLGARDKAVERGLAFTGSNGLGTVFLRFDFLHDESIFAASQADAPTLQIYAQAGAGLLLFNPRSYFGTERPDKTTTYLQPERNDYPALAGVVPVGGGFSVLMTDRLRAGLEANYYITSTDQLDDINVRLGGAGLNKDGFATVMLKLDYALR